MSVVNRSKASKVQQLSQVIAVQERTISKLQKVLDKERTSELNVTSTKKRVPSETQSSSRGQSKKKIKSKYQDQGYRRNRSALSLPKNTTHLILPTFAHPLTDKTPNNKLQLTDRFEDKSSISKHRDEPSIYEQSVIQKSTQLRQQTNNLQQEYQFEIQMIKDKFELFKIESESQERVTKRREKEFMMRIKDNEEQSRLKDDQIQSLKRQLELQKTENKLKKVTNEFHKQKNTWQNLYQDFCDEMCYLKEDLTQYCLLNKLPPRPQRNSFIGDGSCTDPQSYRQYLD